MPVTFRRLCWIAAAGIVALHLWRLWRFAVDWPLQDDLTQLLAVPGYLVQVDLDGKLAQLFALNPDQRVVTLRLAGWLGAMLPGGLNFRFLIGVGNALVLVAGTLVLLIYPRVLRAIAALLAALLLTSMTHSTAQYWTSASLHHFGVSFYALTALFALMHDRWRWLAIPFAFAAAFTSANGLMVFPAVVLMSALQGRRREAIAWVLVGALVISLYFLGSTDRFSQNGMLAVLSEPLHLAGFGLATLGGIGDTLPVSLAIGILIVAGWTVLLAGGAWRRVPVFVLAAMLFVALSCAMIAAGRAALGADAVALPRYRVYSALALLLSFAAVAALTEVRRMRWILATACAGALALYLLAAASAMPHVVHLAMKQNALRDHFAAAGHGHYEGFTQEFGDFTLKRAREIGAYDGVRHAAPPSTLVESSPPSRAATGAMHVDMFRDGPVFSVAGYVERVDRPVRLWLANDRRALSASLATLPYRSWRDARTAFHGTVSLAGLPPGSYEWGVADTDVRWSAGRIEVP